MRMDTNNSGKEQQSGIKGGRRKERAREPRGSQQQQPEATQEVCRVQDNSGGMRADHDNNKSLTGKLKRMNADEDLQTLEQCSEARPGSVSTKGTNHKVSLTFLINKQDWKHVMRRIRGHPRSMRHRHDIELDGIQTRAYPLHHALSQRPPVCMTRLVGLRKLFKVPHI